jgi:hypothetical protein
MTRRFTLAVGIAACAALAGAMVTRPAANTQQSLVPLLVREPTGALFAMTGPHSEVRTPQFRPVASQEVFDKIWLMHSGDDVTKAAQGWPMIPQIDFKSCYALFIFGGDTTNTNGYRVREVITEDDAITVRYETDSYQTASFDGPDHGNAVRPWAMFLIPTPAGRTVILERNVQGMHDLHPEWKQTAVFPGQIGIGQTIQGTEQRGEP